jgi:hypothetical protein
LFFPNAGAGIGFSSAGAEKMRMDNNGNLGIGTPAPTYRLHALVTGAGAVAGFQNDTGTCSITPNTSSLSCSSDIRLKKDVESISADLALEQVLQLQGVTYRWKGRAIAGKNASQDSIVEPSTDSSRHIGFIAQDVERIFPELVNEGADHYKQISYSGFVPVLAESIKALQTKISQSNSAKDAQIAELQKQNEELRAALCDLHPTAKICAP